MNRLRLMFLLVLVLGSALYAQQPPAITPGGVVLLDGKVVDGPAFLRRGRGILLPLASIGKALGAHVSIDASGRQVVWDGQTHPIDGVTVDGVVYVTWWSLQPLAPSVQFGVAGDRVILQRQPVALKPSPGGGSATPPVSDKAGGEAVLAELNRARTQPQQYVQTLQAVRTEYAGTVRHTPDGSHIQTEEGVAAVDEAIAYVQRQPPLEPLSLCKGLTHAASDHVQQTGPVGLIGHVGTDGSTVADRVSRYGKWQITAGENIDYGYADAGDIVSALIIDDGVADRGHRINIFKAEYRLVGIAMGPHVKYGVMCVMDFAGGYIDQ